MSCGCNKPSNCGCNKTSKSSSVIVTEQDNNVLVTSTETSSCVSSGVAAAIVSGNYPIFVTALAAFNLPACGETGEILVDDAGRYPAGAVIWNSAIGQLLIVSAPSATKILVKNECLGCNVKNPGDAVAAGTIFAIGVPSCAGAGNTTVPSSTTPFLNADFVVPAESIAAGYPAKVTNVFGLSIGDVISVASKEFEIGSIPDSTTIFLINKGDGGDANDIIEWDPNDDSSPDYPVVKIGGQNPCTSAEVTTVARLIGCNGSNQQVGLVGDVTGQVASWTGFANGDGEWGLKVVNDLALCVTIGCCLILDPDKDPSDTYLIDVSDTTDLAAHLDAVSPNPLRITIAGDSFCLTEVVDATHAQVRPSFDVTEVTEYEDGAALCVDDCCNQCTPVVSTLGKFTGTETPKEMIVTGTGATASPVGITVATGVSVVTVPVAIGSAGTGATEVGLWTIDLPIDALCGCRKQVTIHNLMECALPLATGLNANVEFRVVKQLPTYENFSAWSGPMHAAFGLLAGLDNSPNLLQGGDPGTLKTLNTHKGYTQLRDFKEPTELNRYRGHIRIVFNNTSGAPIAVSFGHAWRVWATMENYEIAADAIPSAP